MVGTPKSQGRRAARFRKIAAALLIAAVVAFPVVSSAAERFAPVTIGYILDHGCPQARTAFRYELAKQDAGNMGDLRRMRRLAKEASDMWYACSKQASDQYVHDWALEFHDADLATAAKSYDDPWGGLACEQLNDLAYATQYDDVRKEALKMKKFFCQVPEQ